nr:chloroplast ATP-dependent zinc metalloprotease FTSH7/9 [Passiflora tenuiloba]
MSSAIETPRPLPHAKFHAICNSNLQFRCQSRVFPSNPHRFVHNPITFPSTDLCKQSRAFQSFSLWNSKLREYRILPKCQDGDSSAGSPTEQRTETEGQDRTGSNVNPPNSGPEQRRKKEKQEESQWWWSRKRSWNRQTLIEAHEIGVVLLHLGIVLIVMRFLRPDISLPGSQSTTITVPVPYSEFLSKIGNNQVEKVVVDGFHIMFKLKNEESLATASGEAAPASSWQQMESSWRIIEPTTKIVYTTTRPSDIKTPYEKMLENRVEFGSPDRRFGGFFHSAMITLFYVAVIAGLLHQFPVSFFQHPAGRIGSHKSGNSGGSKVSGQGETITFADVAGVDEAKEELEEIVEFLRNPDRYIRLGARPPRGVLLVGLPGTGKTLLAKAVAGEADVPFLSCSASEFVELYVGMGASRVRDLFARAKKEAPSIVFIDEIDAVAKSRDVKSRIGVNDEREQTLNQLLTEMDGFDSSSGVIVLGATNRSDVLDPALRRPGRFDRVVMVETPDRNGREAILKVHVSKKELPLGHDVELGDIASMTTGFTGADLANLVNEAALLAGRKNKLVVERIDFIQAVERSIAGIEKKTAKLQGNEKAVVARHEAGHAVVGTAVANLLHGQPRVEKLSILPRSGGALGFTYIPPTNEDRYLLFVDELRGRLVTLFGGRAAEEVVYSGRVSTGALDDIRRATDMAYKAVAEYGLNHTIGPISVQTLSGGGIDDSGAAAWGRDQGRIVDLAQREVTMLLQSALDVALSVIRANLTVLEGLGAHLEEKEKVEGEELQEWLKLVVAPKELATFVKDKQEALFPLEAGA